MKIRGNTIGTTMKPEKTVVKCKNLTEEEKAIARANIGAASEEIIGMIDNALSAIIEEQEMYISIGDNVQTIAFFINNEEHIAEAGMTFYQWANSKYSHGLAYCTEKNVYYEDRELFTDDGYSNPIRPDDTIFHNKRVYCV